MNWYLKVLKEHYFDFKGRARREEFWMFTLINIVVSILLTLVDTYVFNSVFGVATIYSFAVLIPSIMLVIRRLHDIGKSGWYYFIVLIPFIGAIWLLVLLCTDSESGKNKWGDNPKGIGNDSELDMIGKE